MLKVTAVDYNFYKLVTYIQQPPENASDFVATVQAFRSRLSAHWLDPLVGEDITACLSSVLMALFVHSANSDPNIRINIYSTIGAFVYSLTPFVPTEMMKALSLSIPNVQINPPTSIAVISCFLYIVQFISPVDLDDFIINTPVLHHFSVDVSSFIQHIPHLVPLMKQLPIQFHQNFLRTLLSSFGRSPNHHFVSSVMELLEMNSEKLLSDLMEFIKSNNLTPSLLAFGPHIVSNEKLFNLLSDTYIESFISTAISVLNNPLSNLSDFEQATGTLSAVIKNAKDELLIKTKTRIAEATKGIDYPKHFQKFLLLLPTPLEKLWFENGDNNSVKSAKLKAITTFLLKNESNEEISEKIVDMFLSVEHPEGDVLTTLIQSVTLCLPKLPNFQKLGNLIQKLMIHKSSTWVQNVALVKLLKSVGLDRGCLLVEDFEFSSIDLLLKFSLSAQEELSKAAAEAMPILATNANFEHIQDFLVAIDAFDADQAFRLVAVLERLSDIFPSIYFLRFGPMISELVQIHHSPALVGNCFALLIKLGFDSPTQNLIDCALDWVCRLFKAITQSEPPVTSPLKIDHLPTQISIVQTDIVADDILGAKDAAEPMFNAFEFYVRNEKSIESTNKKILFTKVLLRLFPDRIIELSNLIFTDKTSDEFSNFSASVCKVLQSSSSYKTAAVCARFLSTARGDIRLQHSSEFERLLEQPSVTDPEQIVAFYKIVFFKDELKAASLIRAASERIESENDRVLYQIKLGTFKSDDFDNFTRKVPFSDWPINDTDFKLFLKANPDLKADVDMLVEMDDFHLKFLQQNRVMFKLTNLDEFLKTSAKRMQRFEMKKIQREFKYNPIKECEDPSLAHHLKKGEVNWIPSLILSFLRNSSLEISQDTLTKITEMASKNPDNTHSSSIIEAAIHYAHKFENLYVDQTHILPFIDNQNILENYKFRSDSLFDSILENKFKGWKNADLISEIDLTKYTYKDAAISTDPESFFIRFIGNNNPKSQTFIRLTTFLSRQKIGDKLIDDYCLKMCEGIKYMESPKRLASLIRLVYAHFIAMNPTVAPKERDHFRNEFVTFLAPVVGSDSGSLFSDLARVFRYFFSARGPGTPLLNDLDSFERRSQHLPVFTECLARVYAFSGSGGRIARGGLDDSLKNPLPSSKMRALRALSFMLLPKFRAHSFDAVLSSALCLLESAPIIAKMPIAAETLSETLERLLEHQRFPQLQGSFTQILPIIFADPSTPSFPTFAPLIKLVIQKCPPPLQAYAGFAFRAIGTRAPHAALVFEDFHRFALKFVKNDDIVLEHITALERLFAAAPSVESAKVLAKALRAPADGFDSSFLLVGKMCMLPVPPILVAVLIKEYIMDKDATPTIELVESCAESFPSKERYEGIRLVCRGKYEEAADLIAKERLP